VSKRNRDHFTVGLVGYTNAGKSTLFNALTAGGVRAHHQLFETLSTRIERWELGGGTGAMLSDTVGFIRRLPHHLIASFRSTLEETVHCQLLLIVVDAADPNALTQLETVEETLSEIGAKNQPRILVMNKIDKFQDASERLIWVSRYPEAVQISAVTKDGIDELTDEVRLLVIGPVREIVLSLPSKSSKAIDFVEKRTVVMSRDWEDDRSLYRIKIGLRQLKQVLSREKDLLIDGQPASEALDQLWSSSPL
jgi:GTP-binding protein HflX